MIIRSWEKSDNSEIAKIEQASFKVPWSKEMFDSCFSSHGFYGLVAVDNGLIAGFICTLYLFENADILNVCVEKNHRRQGVGEALLSELTKYLKRENVTNVFLEVRRSNAPAIALYEKAGFIKTGERKKYYEDTEDALIYVKAL